MGGALEQRADEIARLALRGDRDAVIERECAGDDGLRGLVERRLAAWGDATVDTDALGSSGDDDALFEDPAPKSGPTEPDAGERIGRYTVLETLGEGGMGVVYLAEQDRPRRRVALKLIRKGLGSRSLRRRFETEAELLGRLQHPGIAQIFEAGTTEESRGSVPFFAMEHIEGAALGEHCRSRGLSTTERLELLCLVCDAVHHAHTKGVIHRDLKSSNILVDGQWHPKVLDFGVARATDTADFDATVRTEDGQLVGTLAYMSPEQISGRADELDTRSDVYALGVILYELLAGRTPHDVSGLSVYAATQAIVDREPPPLATLDPEFRGDVSTIVAKAMEKDRERRYGSAAELAADIRRHLADLPIEACPPTRMYLATKFAKRNKAGVAGAAAVLLVALVGVVLILRYAQIATVQRGRAERQAEIAEREAQTARMVNSYLNDMLGSANPEAMERTDDPLARDVTVREVVDLTAASIGEAFPGRPMVEAEARSTLGSTYRALGDFEKSEAQYQAAVERCIEAQGEDSRETVVARVNLASVLADMGRTEESEAIVIEARDALIERFGPDDEDAIAVTSDLARLKIELGDPVGAAELLEDSVERGTRAVGADARVTLVAKQNLAAAYKYKGDFESAERTSSEIVEQLTTLRGASHPLTLYAKNNLATLYQRMGRFGEAESLLTETLEARTEILGDLHPSTITTRQNLVNLRIQQGRLEEAEPGAKRVYELCKTELGPEHPKTLLSMSALAYLLEDLGRLDEAESLSREALEVQERVLGRTSQQALTAKNNLASLVLKRGNAEEAAGLFEELVADAEQAFPPGHWIVAIFRNNQGECLTVIGEYQAAEDALLPSFETLRGMLGDSHPRVAKAAGRLVALYETWGRPDSAQPYRGLAGE